ncbi:MAG TPA: winged helix-turn-helix domain-containing protein [Archaeoglobus sp.]|nr:winged helix-turn-helix domain-containing protein [Archaeoglobus sp.]
MNVPLEWYNIIQTGKSLSNIKLVVDTLLANPYASHQRLSEITGIPRSTITKIINRLERIGALQKSLIRLSGMGRKSGYRYKVNPAFVDFLNDLLQSSKDVQFRKPTGFASVQQGKAGSTGSASNSNLSSPDKSSTNSVTVQPRKILTKPENFEELEQWCKDGWFRIHGFQRKWVLRNYRLVDDEEKWKLFASLLNDIPYEKSGEYVRKIKIGRKGSGVGYIVKAYSEKFKVHFLLHFRSHSLIISLPKDESIYISWDDFNDKLEDEIVKEINMIAGRAIRVYTEVFKQQVLAYDDGWVGKKKPLRPEVAYVDPDGITRLVYEVEGATYIEGLGYWIDGSLSSTPELEFETVEKASKFKRAIDAFASGELDEKLESMDRKIDAVREEVKKEISERIEDSVAKGVELAMMKFAEEFTKATFTGGFPIQQQLTEMWKRIADIQESMNLLIMYNMAKESGDSELADAIRERLMNKVMRGR